MSKSVGVSGFYGEPAIRIVINNVFCPLGNAGKALDELNVKNGAIQLCPAQQCFSFSGPLAEARSTRSHC